MNRIIKATVHVIAILGVSVVTATAQITDAKSGSHGPAGPVGTWRVHVDESPGGVPAFNSLHTYGADGTFTETTDLLAKLNEGPGHGSWKRSGRHYLLTFELWAFDPAREPAGIIRVRCLIDVAGDRLEGDATVDFIDLDGTVYRDLDTAKFTGKRIKPLPR
jgi:hypothetical protein